jgi:hypothetical protein
MKQILMLMMAVVMVGCASPPTIRATSQIQIQSVGTVAVLPFNGHNGHQFSDFVAQELILRGAKVVERSKVASVLQEQKLSIADISTGGVNLEKLGGLLGVETFIVGSVSPITVYESGGPSGKVSSASIRFVRIKDGIILASAVYSANTELLAGSVLYPKCAEMLVAKIIASP